MRHRFLAYHTASALPGGTKAEAETETGSVASVRPFGAFFSAKLLLLKKKNDVSIFSHLNPLLIW